jgi:hypothetical protein
MKKLYKEGMQMAYGMGEYQRGIFRNQFKIFYIIK